MFPEVLRTMRNIRNCKVTILVVALAALFFSGCNRGPKEKGIEGMAGMVPSNVLGFIGLDVRDSKNWNAFQEGYKQHSDHPELESKVKTLDSQLGCKTDDLLAGVEPAGWLAVLDGGGKGQPSDAAAVMAFVVRDKARAEACIKDLAQQAEPKVTQSGDLTLKTYPRGFSVCFHGGFVYLGTSEAGLKAVIEHKGEKLNQKAEFLEARGRVDSGKSDIFGYAPMGEALKLVTQSQADLSTLGYLASGIHSDGSERVQVYMSVKDSDSPLGQALLKSPETSGDLARVVPQDWVFFMMNHLGYQFRVGGEICRTSPEGQEVLEEMSVALSNIDSSFDELDKTFTGEMALALDLEDFFSGIPETSPNGTLTFGLKDLKLFNQFWTKLCKAGGISPQSTVKNDVRIDSFNGLPNLLIVQLEEPQPTAVLVFGASPMDVLAEITAIEEGKSLADLPDVKSLLKPANFFTLRYRLAKTMKQLAATGLLALSPEGQGIQAAIQGDNDEMWSGDMSLRVENDGLLADGNKVTMMVGGVMTGAFIYVYLEDQGALPTEAE